MQIFIPIAPILAAAAVPASAQDIQLGAGQYAITLPRADLQSGTPAAAARTLRRIDRAALAVCGGAFDGSLHEVTRAIRSSPCWREAVDTTVRRINAPLLSQAWQARP